VAGGGGIEGLQILDAPAEVAETEGLRQVGALDLAEADGRLFEGVLEPTGLELRLLELLLHALQDRAGPRPRREGHLPGFEHPLPLDVDLLVRRPQAAEPLDEGPHVLGVERPCQEGAVARKAALGLLVPLGVERTRVVVRVSLCDAADLALGGQPTGVNTDPRLAYLAATECHLPHPPGVLPIMDDHDEKFSGVAAAAATFFLGMLGRGLSISVRNSSMSVTRSSIHAHT